jgi:hypothetical protein
MRLSLILASFELVHNTKGATLNHLHMGEFSVIYAALFSHFTHPIFARKEEENEPHHRYVSSVLLARCTKARSEAESHGQERQGKCTERVHLRRGRDGEGIAARTTD